MTLIIKRLAICAALSAQTFAATYYVDYTNGQDTRTSTQAQSKSTPWKYAPGMYGATSNAAAFNPAAGDQIIFKGCVTWPNSAFPWGIKTSGTATNPVYGMTGPTAGSTLVYYGVDKTWWDNTVTGCASAWNRPIFNGGAATTANRGYNAGRPAENILVSRQNYIQVDNIEFTNQLATAASDPYYSAAVDLTPGSPGSLYNHYTNLYMHGWVMDGTCVGTGNVSGSTVTNFVPSSACYPGFPATIPGASIGTQANTTSRPFGPTVSSITGSNPYTINASGALPANCTGCWITMGHTDWYAFSGDTASGNVGTTVENSIIDGFDSPYVQLNPYPDCGASEGNNNPCMASGQAGWHGPSIWRNNVLRYLDNDFVGGILREVSGNSILYSGRFMMNWSGHNNVLEPIFSTPSSPSNVYYYNNYVQGMGTANASASGGQATIGWAMTTCTPTGYTAYLFNNVVWDSANTMAQFTVDPSAQCGGTGNTVAFNNTIGCGPVWGQTALCLSGAGRMTSFNNHLIGNSTLVTGVTQSPATDLGKTTTQATNGGFSQASTYVYSPQSSGAYTVGVGASGAATCSAITDATAQAACLKDTTYGVTFAPATHQVIGPGRATVTRSTWDVGAYQYGPPTCTISPTSLPTYTEGQAVSQQFSAANCTAGLNWSIALESPSGCMAARGVNLSSGGLLAGASVTAGTCDFTVAYDMATDPLTLTITAGSSPASGVISVGAIGSGVIR